MDQDTSEGPGPEGAISALVDALRADESIVADTVRILLDTVPGYDGVSTDSLERSTRRNIRLSTQVIRDGHVPTGEDLTEAEELATERLAQGVSLGSVLSGFRVSMSVILERLLALAPTHGVTASEALSFSTGLWALADAFSSRALRVYQEQGIAAAAADSARRLQWIVDAVVRGHEPVELRRGVTAYAVPTDRAVRAFHLTRLQQEGLDPTGLVQFVLASVPGALAAPYGSAAVGILPDEGAVPQVPVELLLAVGPAVVPEDLPRSYLTATRVHEAALATGLGAAVDLERLSWRSGVATSPDTTRVLEQRLLAPVQAHGTFGDLLLESLAAYLDNDLNIARAAAAIPVHVNTLRYRLRRYEDLTGVDTQNLNTVVEIAWVLAARKGMNRSR
ncbi:PucR family transcriptional regulator [Kocuria soli]|uniref:PucR family transcriptional regulator n=1 Tax=Kocuria soli TaxID=2485125 RepID=A0A3N3ZNU3_9MICC|nr:helix-turn-helix domain-containing protein [Kocuria soli]ROZ62605.1 PucR family transcriptional regulator [Kocuria soli]